MVSIRPVVRADLDRLFALKVLDAQAGFVAPNAVTLAEIAYLSGGYVFCICRDGDIVGLLAMVDFREHDELMDGDNPDAALILRLMVGAPFQGQGVGRAAVGQAIGWARQRGNGCIQTSVVPANAAARRLYVGLGFRETGRIVEGEIEMELGL